MKIRKEISNNTNHYNGTNKKLFITIHDTGNQSKGANAEMHRQFINNGSSSTWHYTVDKDEAVQHFEHSTQCWHAGDGRGNGNLNSIGIEMCINSDGDYVQTVKNTAELVKKLMKDLNVAIDNIVQHNHWSGKDCPRQMRNGREGINWNGFKEMVQGSSVKTVSDERITTEELAAEVNRGLHGNGEERKRSLGSRYQEVQDFINGKNSVAKPTVKNKTTKQLVDEVNRGLHGNGEARKQSLGSRYQEVQDYINGKSSKSNRKTTKQLADEVNRGLHGNGETRKNSLGSRYQEVQDYINKHS